MSVKIVVSDTSPIRALAHLEMVELLDALYGEILIPPAVVTELARQTIRFASLNIDPYPFLKVVAPANRRRVSELRAILDPGESESIALAEELRADHLLIDERRGRDQAIRLSLRPIGALGMLLRAKELGIIGAVVPLLDQLEQEINFFVSPSLRAEVLRQSKE